LNLDSDSEDVPPIISDESPSLLTRVRRQIPFLSKWFSSSVSDSSSGGTSSSLSNRQRSSHRNKVANPPPIALNNGTVPPNGSLVADPHRDGRCKSLSFSK
jgi:hypothetical protein